MSNLELVENGIGFVNNIHRWWPEIMLPLEWRWSTESTGVSSMTSARSDRCDIRFSGGPYSNGGFVSGYRFWGELWDYVGIQVTGTGTMDDWEDGARVSISNVKFRGFSGIDNCNRTNVAITNDIADIGRGKQGNAATGNYGFAFCQPVFLDRSTFEGIPLKGRLRFAWGSAQNGDDLDYGFSECIVYDKDRVALASSLPVGVATRPSFSFRRPPGGGQIRIRRIANTPLRTHFGGIRGMGLTQSIAAHRGFTWIHRC